MAEEFKVKGNKALQNGNVEEAIAMYSKAIELDDKNHILYSNRSAAYSKNEMHEEALKDAEKCIQVNPNWAKGYSRKGAALEFLGKIDDAIDAYESGLKIEPNNDNIKTSLSNLKSSSSPFSGPAVISKLEANPQTREYLKDPQFRMKLDLLSKNPDMISQFLSDKKILDAFSVLIGIDPNMMKTFNSNDFPAATSTEFPKYSETESKNDVKPTKSLGTEEQNAFEAKNLGNAAYKQKKFEEALTHYDKAISIISNDITFYNNKSAVYFEMCDYTKCIKECEIAVEIGRENLADFKLVAKAFARMANAYWKLDDLANAKKFFDKSLSEHRDPDIVKKSQNLLKIVKERERLSLIDPVLAEKEKVLGNDAFQNGEFPNALKHYSEAISKNPDDAKLYSNRAACYTKLMEFSLAIRDCDKCIILDPNFIKGYLRKGAVLTAMKEHSKAAEIYKRALTIDNNCAEALDGYREASRLDTNPESAEERIMNDPEVQEILSDPAMQMILGQMQKDPTALREHLRNPAIASKIQKLMEAGVIGVR